MINHFPETLPSTCFASPPNIRSGTVIYRGSVIGEKLTTGHNVLIRENCTIGDNVSIGTNSVCEHTVWIGKNVRIHTGVFLPEYTVIEENAWIGPCSVFTNAKYPNQPDTKQKLQGCRVMRGAIIGANVTVLPGTIIGENALIGAGSVVTSDVPKNSKYAGNPAREL